MQLALFIKEEQGRRNAAEPTESQKFEMLRLELVNWLLKEAKCFIQLDSLNDEGACRIRQALRRRQGGASKVRFCAITLELTLNMKWYWNFTSNDLRKHIEEVKQMAKTLE